MLIFILLFFATYITASPFDTVLRMGHRGDAVEKLQQLLADMGYNVSVDGIFGAETHTIVKAVQISFGLSADGVVGKKTWDIIRQATPLVNYTVRSGDNLTRIANNFDTTISAIKMANDLKNDQIFIGQTLQIPRSWMGGASLPALSSPSNEIRKLEYTVERGETLSHLAQRFSVTVADIKAANNLNSDLIRVGDRLIIPREIDPDKPGLSTGNLIWPAVGRISSPFGNRVHPIYGGTQFHTGIDIVLSRGTPIRAVAPGLVTLSDWNGGYGLTMIIDHGDGYETLYAHNDNLLVRAGAYVMEGQIIALSGNTGLSTGPHLHFEIIKDDKHVNPLNYLTPR